MVCFGRMHLTRLQISWILRRSRSAAWSALRCDSGLSDGHCERAHRKSWPRPRILVVRSGHCERAHFEAHGHWARMPVWYPYFSYPIGGEGSYVGWLQSGLYIRDASGIIRQKELGPVIGPMLTLTLKRALGLKSGNRLSFGVRRWATAPHVPAIPNPWLPGCCSRHHGRGRGQNFAAVWD